MAMLEQGTYLKAFAPNYFRLGTARKLIIFECLEEMPQGLIDDAV